MSLITSLPAASSMSAEKTSTTMWRPASAPPSPAPTMMFSEIGVSTTRAGPNSSTRPVVTRAMPPDVATISPRTIRSSSSRISSRSTCAIALLTVIGSDMLGDLSAVAVAVDGVLVGIGRGVGGREGLVDALDGLLAQCRDGVGVQCPRLDQPALEALDRVLGPPRVDLGLAAVVEAAEEVGLGG